MNNFFRNQNLLFLTFAAALIFLAGGCGGSKAIKNYRPPPLRDTELRSILIVPVVNRSHNVQAPDFFLSTISRPVAERGYYVFPVNLVKRVLEDDGLADADLVHAADTPRVAGLFGADSVLYVSIERWDARYALFETIITVEFNYVLKDGGTGEILWKMTKRIVHSNNNQSNNTGNPLADLIAQAVVAAVTKGAPDYVPLARRANRQVIRSLPYGPYMDETQNAESPDD